MSDFVQSVISGVLGGLAVLVFQKYWDFSEKNKEREMLRAEKLQEVEDRKIIDPAKGHKYVHADIANSLLPGTAIAKMKDVLGIPDSHYKGYISVFGEVLPDSYVYYYEFLNAEIVVTINDENLISSVTVESKLIQTHPIRCIYPFSDDNSILGELTVTEEIMERCAHHVADYTVRDAWFAIEVYFGRIGRYSQYTFFGSEVEKIQEYQSTHDPSVFLNSTIDGFCISSDEKSAYYIGVV